MRLRLMKTTVGEEQIRSLVNKSKFSGHWRVYMHPVVALDGGWFLPAHGGSDLRAIWMNKGSVTKMMPRVVEQEVWELWHELEGVVAAIPTAVIHNQKSGEAIMINVVDDMSGPDQVRQSLAANNALVKELPSLYFTEAELIGNPEEMMMWLCRAFLDPGQSHLALVRGDHKVVVA